MPTLSVQYYSLSFHPTLDEWSKYKDLFIDNFKKKCNGYRVLVTKEKGSKNQYTHYQGVIDCGKDIRADSFRKSCENTFLKDIELFSVKTALKLTPITRDWKCCLGYTLKETNDDLSSVIVSDYSVEEMVQFKDYYLNLVREKNIKKDRIRVTRKTLPEIFKNYCIANDLMDNFQLLGTSRVAKEVDFKNRCFYKVGLVLAKMAEDDYYMLPIINSKDFKSDCDYLICYMMGLMENYVFDKIDKFESK